MRLRRVSNFLRIQSSRSIRSGQRGDIFPGQQGFRIKLQRLLHISRNIMNDAAGNGFLVVIPLPTGAGWVEKPTSLLDSSPAG